MRRPLVAVLAAFALLLVGGVAVAAGTTYTPPCTAKTTACRDQQLAALASAMNSVDARLDKLSAPPTVTATATATVTATATATVTASPTPTPTSPSPSPTPTSTGLCSPVVFSTSEATGTWNNDAAGLWWVDNDAWNGSHGPQTINVCSATSWYAVSNQTDNQGQVETYPNSEYDVGGRNNGLPTKTINQYQSISSTFAEQFPTDGSMDASYDLWLNNWGTEVMVWNEVHGTNSYWLTQGTTVTVGGVQYQFVNLTDEFIFIQKTQTKSGAVDLLAVFKYLVAQGLVKGTDVPTQLEYGVEISATVGAETFPLTGLTFSLS